MESANVILDPDVCIQSDESVSEYAGRVAGMITSLRRTVLEYSKGNKTMEELLKEAMIVDEQEQVMKEESPVTELLLDQLDELRHAISQHQMTVMAANAYDVNTMTEANRKLWAILK